MFIQHNKQGIPSMNPPTTSEKKCTPRHTLENATTTIKKQKSKPNVILINLLDFSVIKQNKVI